MNINPPAFSKPLHNRQIAVIGQPPETLARELRLFGHLIVVDRDDTSFHMLAYPALSLIIVHGDEQEALIDLTRELRRLHALVPILLYADCFSFDAYVDYMDAGANFLIATDAHPEQINRILERALTQYEKTRSLSRSNEESIKQIQQVQNMMIELMPKETNEEPVQFNYLYHPSFILSGDLLDYHHVSPVFKVLFLLDISGHGFHSAMIAMYLRSLLTGLANRVREPDQILFELNSHLCKFNDRSGDIKFATAVCATMDLEQNILKIANAGNPSPYLIKNGELEAIGPDTHPIGIRTDFKAVVHSYRQQQCDGLFLYTDGLYEDQDAFIDNDRLVEEAVLSSLHLMHDPKALIRHVRNAFPLASGDPDDATLAILTWPLN
ncbi:PP2C family protein-serine/threonine phosphatase [Salisediminibacterium selenitireducens]|uniref:Protein serine/threonine phosphatase n=1 Tax=Bacillus selenitireducens (strain ATCC 700615 / DSM 15326 / MLS10) TaxID=439292 RepID=D6XY93_BACIE|nr:fused response regulator/phosphatase [Salisediminibacterium selenitireducens]ADH98166.1 protein serine/threonine phosphatase [[Bacillus] selenitireducens MLS10]